MDDDELKAVLEDAGLSPYQAAAYVALLDLGSATATDVANACEVPDPRIYDVLRDLDEMGYVETYQQDCLRARAHDPEEVLEDLRDQSSQYLSAAEEIEERWNEPAAADHEVSIVKRFETVLSRSRELVDRAEDEVVLGITPELYRELRADLAEAHDRGVVVKLCLFTEEDAGSIPAAEDLAGCCTEARHRTIPAGFLVVADRQWTCFAPERESASGYGVLINDHTHTHVFYWFFRSALWETWETIYAEPSEDLPVTYVDLVECLRRVVPLLEAGATVEVTVEGSDTATMDRIDVVGRIVDTEYSGVAVDLEDVVPLEPLAGRNNFTVETGDGERYTIGGWGARLEDVEARRITITDVTET